MQNAKKELEDIEEIDIILGNDEKKDILRHVENFQRKRIEEVKDISKIKEYLEFGNITYTENKRAFIKIQDGCNNFCTYCAIPYARGRIRSRKVQSIIEEITEIASKGIKEIVLTGIQIASYGKDLEDNILLIDLLEEINKIKDVERVRLRFARINFNHRRIYRKTKKIRKDL